MNGVRIGVIGVGEMGRPVVDRLLAAGHCVAAFVRKPALKDELAALGVEISSSVEALAKGRQFVILYVYADDQVREIALKGGLVDAMEAGSTLIIHTTGSPKTAEMIAARAGPRGVRVVDAAGSGGPAKVAAGNVTMMVGGTVEDFDRCRAVLSAYANPVFHIGPLGSGQRLKLVNNVMLGAHAQLALEACRLGSEFGLDPGELARVLGHCSGDSAALRMLAASGSSEAFIQGVGRFIYKDVAVVTEVAAELGADLGLLRTVTDPLMSTLRDAEAEG